MQGKVRRRLMAKSLLCFGTTSRWEKMMNKGRRITDKAGTFIHTAPISIQEIEDSMDYILSERKKIQTKVLEEIKNERPRAKENDKRGSNPTQSDGTTAETRES